MIVFTIDIGQLIGLAISGVLILILIGIYICKRVSEYIDKRRSRK